MLPVHCWVWESQTLQRNAIIMIWLTLVILLATSDGKILRNNALMSQMVSNFHKESSNQEREPEQSKSEPVLYRMQNLLCKNFKTIPCELIIQDPMLRKLIEKSIQQINYKKLELDKTTHTPRYLTLFPIINDNFSNYFRNEKNSKPSNDKTKTKHKKSRKSDAKRTSVYTRKRIRKFYPHKVKYKDKNNKNGYNDYSEEKLSMSVEIPDMTLTRKHQHLSYKVEPENPPIWRIDYTKHGEPSLNMFTFDTDRLKDKIMKTGQNVVVEDNNILDKAPRKDVLHPDVYIKNNYNRNNFNSDIIEK